MTRYKIKQITCVLMAFIYLILGFWTYKKYGKEYIDIVILLMGVFVGIITTVIFLIKRKNDDIPLKELVALENQKKHKPLKLLMPED